MDNSSEHKTPRMIQFAAYRRELPTKLDRDVLDSSYKNKTQYANALFERCLSIEKRFQCRSCIDELNYILDLHAAMPMELLEELIANHLERQQSKQTLPSERLLAQKSIGNRSVRN